MLHYQVAQIQLLRKEHKPLPVFLVQEASAVEGTIATTSQNIKQIKASIIALKQSNAKANQKATTKDQQLVANTGSWVGEQAQTNNQDMQKIQQQAGPGASEQAIRQANLEIAEMQAQMTEERNVLLAEQVALAQQEAQTKRMVKAEISANTAASSQALNNSMSQYFNAPVTDQETPPPCAVSDVDC